MKDKGRFATEQNARFESRFVSIPQCCNLSLEDLGNVDHVGPDGRMRLPTPFHKDTQWCGPDVLVQPRTFVPPYHKVRVVLAGHTIVGQVQRTDLPEQQSKAVNIGRQVVRFTESDCKQNRKKKTCESGTDQNFADKRTVDVLILCPFPWFVNVPSGAMYRRDPVLPLSS